MALNASNTNNLEQLALKGLTNRRANLMWFYSGSHLRCQEYIRLIRRMSNVDKDTAARVGLIQCIIDVITTGLQVSITSFIKLISIISRQQLNLTVIFIRTRYLNYICTTHSAVESYSEVNKMETYESLVGNDIDKMIINARGNCFSGVVFAASRVVRTGKVV